MENSSELSTEDEVLWSEQEIRILEAARRCFSKWGISKTTVDDIAREANISRATLYRAFPSGRDSVIENSIELETNRFFQDVCEILDRAKTLRELLISGMAGAWTILSNDEVLSFLLTNEPELVLRNLAFDRLERLIAICREILTPYLSKWLEFSEANHLAEWAARIVVSYAISPPDWSESAQATAETLVTGILAAHFDYISCDIDSKLAYKPKRKGVPKWHFKTYQMKN